MHLARQILPDKCLVQPLRPQIGPELVVSAVSARGLALFTTPQPQAGLIIGMARPEGLEPPTS